MRIVLSLDKTGLDNDYVKSLLAAGVRTDEIAFLPVEAAKAGEAVGSADGLLLGGGADVEPARYGEPVRYDSVEFDAARDERELAAYSAARKRALPVLAICRGLQLVNVALGGTLIQDIPGEISEPSVPHRVFPKDAAAHSVLFDPTPAALPLRSCFQEETVFVNSRHHQAALRIATDLRVAALAPDGIVEALVEKKSTHSFFAAVQWHPENMDPSTGHGEIFRRFVKACKEHVQRTATLESFHAAVEVER